MRTIGVAFETLQTEGWVAAWDRIQEECRKHGIQLLEAVIVGGGLGSAAGLYWETLVPATRRHIWSDTHRDLPIHQSALGSDAGLIGAAAKVWLIR